MKKTVGQKNPQSDSSKRLIANVEGARKKALKSSAQRREIDFYLKALDALAEIDPEQTMRLVVEFSSARPDDQYLLPHIVMRAHGLSEFEALIYSALDDHELFNQLPAPAQRYAAAKGFFATADEGLEQIYTTSAYNEIEHVVAVLDEIGWHRYADYLRGLFELFGPGGLPRDYHARQRAIADMMPPGTSPLNGGGIFSFLKPVIKEFSDKFWSVDHDEPKNPRGSDLDYLLSLYAADHKDALKQCVKILKCHRAS